MTAIPKAELMRRLRKRRKDDKLLKVSAYIKQVHKARHKRFVEVNLKGEVGS